MVGIVLGWEQHSWQAGLEFQHSGEAGAENGMRIDDGICVGVAAAFPSGRAGIPAPPPGSQELLCSGKRLHELPVEVEHLQRLLQPQAAKPWL